MAVIKPEDEMPEIALKRGEDNHSSRSLTSLNRSYSFVLSETSIFCLHSEMHNSQENEFIGFFSFTCYPKGNYWWKRIKNSSEDVVFL